MYKKILVPLDSSELAECALEHVRAITAGGQVPEVVLLHVTQPITGSYLVQELNEAMRRDAEYRSTMYGKDYLVRVADNLSKEIGSLSKEADSLKKEGTAVKTIIIPGKPAEEILDYAEKNGVDLIVMSTHGRSGPSRWTFGSVADRVLRHSPTPVLIVAPHGCRI